MQAKEAKKHSDAALKLVLEKLITITFEERIPALEIGPLLDITPEGPKLVWSIKPLEIYAVTVSVYTRLTTQMQNRFQAAIESVTDGRPQIAGLWDASWQEFTEALAITYGIPVT